MENVEKHDPSKNSIRKSNVIKTPRNDRIFYAIVNTGLGFFTLLILLPLINIVASSFSSVEAVRNGRVTLWPVSPSLDGYKAVFEYPGIMRSYANTFYYTILGTAINLVMTMSCAYAMSFNDLPFHSFFTTLFMFTMYFSGGTIPNYLLAREMGILDTTWAMVLPGAMSIYNMIVARTFIRSIPDEIREAAIIDGCSDIIYFFKMILPLSGTVMAVLALYYAVGHWNNYFTAFLYLKSESKLPLQLTLRAILIKNSIDLTNLVGVDPEALLLQQDLSDLLKYALIMVASVPILCLYPVVKRYFMKGVMIGAVKG